MTLPKGKLVPVGKVSGVHGVSGWVKIYSDTQPRENIFRYQPWFLRVGASARRSLGAVPVSGVSDSHAFEVVSWRKQGKTLIAKLKGIEDRDAATALIGTPISSAQEQLPSLNKGEFYWSQLIGLRVEASVDSKMLDLGFGEVLFIKGHSHGLILPIRLSIFCGQSTYRHPRRDVRGEKHRKRAHRQKCPAHQARHLILHAIIRPYEVGMMMISTRRFCARPSGVRLDEMGASSPRPMVRMRLDGTPCPSSTLDTDCARRCDRFWL